MTDIIFCQFGPFFPFYPWKSGKSKFYKNEKKKKKKPWILSHFTQVHHKWQWWCTVPEISASDNIFHHFRPFFALSPQITTQKTQNLEKMIKTPAATITSVPKIMITCYTVSETWHVMNVIFIFHFGLFCSLLHH